MLRHVDDYTYIFEPFYTPGNPFNENFFKDYIKCLQMLENKFPNENFKVPSIFLLDFPRLEHGTYSKTINILVDSEKSLEPILDILNIQGGSETILTVL
jgi:hypothetical protein